MAKEWILNGATSRFQLNFKRNVGAVAHAIRTCAPKSVDEWLKESHARFKAEFGGAVFYVFSAKENGRKTIQNPQVVEEIAAEIARLESP